MAIDAKYGRVTLENGDIGENEPVVVFRARDNQLPKLLLYYHLFCAKVGSPKKHLGLIMSTRETILKWQEDNPTLVRVPRSRARRKKS